MRWRVAVLSLGVIACTAGRPKEPAINHVRVVGTSSSASGNLTWCNTFVSNVSIANDSERAIRVTAVDLLTNKYHRVSIDLVIPPNSEASAELGRKFSETHSEALKLSGCLKPPQHGDPPSTEESKVAAAEYVD
jgi:hypothetical protein